MTTQIVTLWVGPALGRMERMCLASFVAHGHPVALYGYGEIGNLPPGVERRDAATVVPASDLQRIAGTPPALALFADYFRLRLMQQSAGLWVDTDVACLRPFEVGGDFVAGWESADYINNAVLRLAPDSPILADALAILASGRTPDWTPFHRAPAARLKTLFGRRVAPWELPRGTFGPKAMTALARRHGLAQAARPAEVFYPLHPRLAERLYDPTLQLGDIVTERSLTIHLWNEKLSGLKSTEPPPGSILAALFARYPG